jgi:hypothetical protein
MSYKRLSFLILGQTAILLPIFYSIKKLIEGDSSFTFLLVFFIICFIYSLSFVVSEIRKVRMDRLDGVQSNLLVLCNYNVYSKTSRDNMPPIPIATFKLYDKDEFIVLSGDYSNINLVEGRKYKVKYYKNSGLLVDIQETNNKI